MGMPYSAASAVSLDASKIHFSIFLQNTEESVSSSTFHVLHRPVDCLAIECLECIHLCTFRSIGRATQYCKALSLHNRDGP